MLAVDIPARTRAAIVAFESENDELSSFIMGELTDTLIDRGIEVVDRQNLGAVFASDETALSIGNFFNM